MLATLPRLAAAGVAAALLTLPATSNACVWPEDAANDWKFQVSGISGYCSSAKDAKQICKTWLKQCKKRVSAATRCVFSDLKTSRTFRRATCKVDPDVVDAKECQALVNGIIKGQMEDTRQNKQVSFDICKGFESNCQDQCTP
jgi:hypothetical protein